jgi:hypothetical protein
VETFLAKQDKVHLYMVQSTALLNIKLLLKHFLGVLGKRVFLPLVADLEIKPSSSGTLNQDN